MRIDPAGIADLIPKESERRNKWIKRPPPEPVAPIQPDPPAKDKPPVADAHLKQWFDLYSKVYTGQEETEANAISSAEGMFFDRSVARARIRKLRGPKTRGKKPKEP